MPEVVRDPDDERSHSQPQEEARQQQQQRIVDEHYMRLALQVAERALEEGEVPVGCVIVRTMVPRLSHDHPEKQMPVPDPAAPVSLEHDSVVISHGANQVNACRDATRHAELVALDRLLTGSVSTDRLRLPESYLQTKKKKNKKRKRAADPPNNNTTTTTRIRRRMHPSSKPEETAEEWKDHWINVPDDPSHWKNGYGWRGTAIAIATATAGAVRPLRHVRAVHHVRRGARPDGWLAEGGLWLSQRQVWRVRVDPVVASKENSNRQATESSPQQKKK